MRDPTPAESKFLHDAEAIQYAMETRFWPVLQDFCQEVSRESLAQAQLRPEMCQWYSGAAKVALDIFDRLNDVPRQRQEKLQELAAADPVADEPNIGPTGSTIRQPRSEL